MRKLTRIAKGKLEELRVERVDGVGKPATGHKWVIVKAEAEKTEVEKAEELRKAAETAVAALLKEAGIEFTEETAEALHALAALLELDVEFKQASAEETEEPAEVEETEEVEVEASAEEREETEETEEREEQEDGPVMKSDLKGLLREALGELVSEEEEAERGEAPTTRLSKSRQPKGQEDGKGKGSEIKKGEGLFEDIIFEQ